ncbi:10057_t:CDS:1, partial [Cetraspora pellucida]
KSKDSDIVSKRLNNLLNEFKNISKLLGVPEIIIAVKAINSL